MYIHAGQLETATCTYMYMYLHVVTHFHNMLSPLQFSTPSGANTNVVHLPPTGHHDDAVVGSEVTPQLTQYLTVGSADNLETTPIGTQVSPPQSQPAVKRLSVDIQRQQTEKTRPEGN